jgi:hypothetical protein
MVVEEEWVFSLALGFDILEGSSAVEVIIDVALLQS